MPYNVPQNIDHDKIFLVNFSELEGRWDPTFTIYNKNINHYAFPIVRLQDLIAKNPQYGTAESGIPRISELAPRYIRITDIDELGNLDDGLGATAENIEMQYILNENDILFARSGATVGKAYLHRKQPYVCFFAGYMIRFVVDNTKILPQYLFIYTQLKPYKDWVKAIQRAAAQPNINAEEYKSLPTSLPPLHIQQQIVDVYNAALSLRKKKLSVSKAKLASIDKYLLDELGITLPQKDNSLEKRIFTVNFSKVSGRRLDPFWQTVQHEKMTSNKFQEFTVKSLAMLQKGTSITSDEIIEGDYPVIAGGQTSPYSHNEYNFEGNVITISASGAYSGYVWYHDKHIFASDCTVLQSIDENKCLTKYLYEILRLKQQELYNLQQGAGQPHVYPQDIAKILIPLPPLEKQREIANNISAIRAEAKRLEQEGEEILQSARLQVEQMILGEKDIEG